MARFVSSRTPALPDPLGRFPFAIHEGGTELPVCSVLIVRSAQQSKVLDRRLATASDWHHVIDLQPTARAASSAVLAHERAPALVPLPDGAADMTWDVTRIRAGMPARPLRSVGRGGPASIDLTAKSLQGTGEDVRNGRSFVTERSPEVLEVVASVIVHHELHAVRVGGD